MKCPARHESEPNCEDQLENYYSKTAVKFLFSLTKHS